MCYGTLFTVEKISPWVGLEPSTTISVGQGLTNWLPGSRSAGKFRKIIVIKVLASAVIWVIPEEQFSCNHNVPNRFWLEFILWHGGWASYAVLIRHFHERLKQKCFILKIQIKNKLLQFWSKMSSVIMQNNYIFISWWRIGPKNSLRWLKELCHLGKKAPFSVCHELMNTFVSILCVDNHCSNSELSVILHLCLWTALYVDSVQNVWLFYRFWSAVFSLPVQGAIIVTLTLAPALVLALVSAWASLFKVLHQSFLCYGPGTGRQAILYGDRSCYTYWSTLSLAAAL